MRIRVENGLVILDLGGSKRDMLLSVDDALKLAEGLKVMLLAEKRIIRNEAWECKVESYDGKVALRFCYPGIGLSSEVPLTVEAARKLARVIENKAMQAKDNMRLILSGGQ